MEKAYDLGALVDILKDQGLDLAEDAAKIVVDAVLEWVAQSAAKSENKYDDLLIAVLPILKTEALKLVDHIDGKDDDGDGKPAAPVAAE